MGAGGELALSRRRWGYHVVAHGLSRSALHLCPRNIDSCIVLPADGALSQAHLGQCEGLGSTLRMSPAHDAEQHLALPPQAVKRPHPLALARCSAQKLICLPFERLAEVEHGERSQQSWLETL